jgi:hypothetical protein
VLTDIAHVAASDETSIAPTADVTWAGTVSIDTMTLDVVPPLPTGATIRTSCAPSSATNGGDSLAMASGRAARATRGDGT